MRSVLNHVFTPLVDFIFPPICLVCRCSVTQHGDLCPDCWHAIDFIHAPLCSHCGVPFTFCTDSFDSSVCADCITSPPHYSMARSAFRYTDGSAKLVFDLKYYDHTYGARTFAAWLYRAGYDCLAGADLLIPVPLHPRRLLRRLYNQSALLCYELSSLSGIPAHFSLLRRTRHVPAQTQLTRKQRLQNVTHVFACPAPARAMLSGKTVVLIDDVLTTGSTVQACSQTLLRAGAHDVRVLTLARTAS